MKKIKAKFDSSTAKMTGRIESLQKKIEQDSKELSDLKEAYEIAVLADSHDVLAMKERIDINQSLLDDQIERLELLKGGLDPVIKKAANVAAHEYAKERNSHEKKVSKFHDSIKKAKTAYIQAVAKACMEDESFVNQRVEVKSLLKHADDSVIQELELESDRDSATDKIERFFHLYEHQVHYEELADAVRSMY